MQYKLYLRATQRFVSRDWLPAPLASSRPLQLNIKVFVILIDSLRLRRDPQHF
jgi:hypothetical protein